MIPKFGTWEISNLFANVQSFDLCVKFAIFCSKTSLNLAISRIKLLQNKRDLHLKQMRKEIAQFLQAGQEAIARIRVEHVIREQNIWAAFEILELFCEFVLARVPIIESQRDCPPELREAIASIIFAAPRCSDVPDLLQLKNLFATKYGKEFISAAAELRPDSSVNRMIVEKLSVSAPSGEAKLKVLKDISAEYNLKWDSSNTEAEFSKKHEDLLAGAKEISTEAEVSQPPSRQGPSLTKPSCEASPVTTSVGDQNAKHIQAPSSSNSISSLSNNEIKSSPQNHNVARASDLRIATRPQSADVLEKARVAIASAEHACTAARAAAALVHINFGLSK